MSIIIKKVDSRIPEVLPSLWRRLTFPIAGLVIMIGSLCYILYFSVEKENPEMIPLIKANTGVYRVKPENPGGLSVAHQDKLVYERLSIQEPLEYEAQFIPAVEAPINVEELSAEKAGSSIEGTSSFSLSQENQTLKASSQPLLSEAKKKQPLSAPSSAQIAPEEGITLKHTDKKSVLKSPQKFYRLQIASSRSSEILVKEWQRLHHLYPEILKNHQPIYLRLKEDTGIYYALRIGNFSNLNELKKLQQKLHQKKINCKIIEVI